MPKRTGHSGRHLVVLNPGAGRSGAAAIQNATGVRIGNSSDLGRNAPAHLERGEGVLFERLGVALLHSDPDQTQGLATHAAAHSLIVEAERIVCASATALPFADTTDTAWGLQATQVLSSPYSGRGVRVAILDTGIDLTHPDFAGRAIVSQSFVANLTIDDVNGHGTCCAGIACGPRQPSQGPRYGVAFAADLYIAKVLDDSAGGVDGNILAGIDWAVANRCAVVSMSLGTPVLVGDPYSKVFEQVASRALDAGTLLIAAAGNESARPTDLRAVEHPANCPSILGIAAVNQSFQVAPFSNAGLQAGGGEVDLAGPGVAVFSSWSHPILYQTDNGTSMSTPFVAGLAALLAESKPLARGQALRDLLVQTCLPVNLPAKDVGAGLALAPQ